MKAGLNPTQIGIEEQKVDEAQRSIFALSSGITQRERELDQET